MAKKNTHTNQKQTKKHTKLYPRYNLNPFVRQLVTCASIWISDAIATLVWLQLWKFPFQLLDRSVFRQIVQYTAYLRRFVGENRCARPTYKSAMKRIKGESRIFVVHTCVVPPSERWDKLFECYELRENIYFTLFFRWLNKCFIHTFSKNILIYFFFIFIRYTKTKCRHN